MAATHEESDDMMEEKQVAFGDDVLSQISHAEASRVTTGSTISFIDAFKKNTWSMIAGRCLKFIPLSRVRHGRYPWQLFIITGLGWFADNLWIYSLSIVLAQVQQELNPVPVEYAV